MSRGVKALLVARLFVATFVYLVLAFVCLIATTVIFQPSDVHPDHWEISVYDYVAQAALFVLYVWQSARQVKRHNK